jgi:hypothetical protein
MLLLDNTLHEHGPGQHQYVSDATDCTHTK